MNGNQSNNNAPFAGAAYVFVRDGASWSQQAYVKASNPGFHDLFGKTLAASGDLLVAGAAGEQSQSTGVGGDQSDDSAELAGAAYVFRRDSGHWSQISYVKSSYVLAFQRFGEALAVCGPILAVAAPTEAGTGTGVNGDQSVQLADSAGAAYAFDLEPGPWTDLTFGLAGSDGTPSLAGSGPLTAASSGSLQLGAAHPSALVLLAVGLQNLTQSFKQGTFVPLPILLVPLFADGAGLQSLPFTWPSGIPAGTAFYLQCWIADPGAAAGWSASNALEGVAH